ncbi:hypothetical protein DB346_22690 [Verrucomicrobia bacterium LW23]|nr:hypothetical protein DB346_22690 [Verrucomicrobia bacterium LW23]
MKKYAILAAAAIGMTAMSLLAKEAAPAGATNVPAGGAAPQQAPGGDAASQNPANKPFLDRLDAVKIASTATSPVNLIISAAIIISFLVQKYGAALGELRGFSRTMRENNGGKNMPNLKEQMHLISRRVRVLRCATQCLASTIVLFIITVLATSVSIVQPDAAAAKIVAAAFMGLGLLTMMVGVLLEIADNLLSSQSFRAEEEDLQRHIEEK